MFSRYIDIIFDKIWLIYNKLNVKKKTAPLSIYN